MLRPERLVDSCRLRAATPPVCASAGIRYVVDAGRSKQRLLEGGGGSGLARFEVRWISKAGAAQRAGRAGRTGPGHCYRSASTSRRHIPVVMQLSGARWRVLLRSAGGSLYWTLSTTPDLQRWPVGHRRIAQLDGIHWWGVEILQRFPARLHPDHPGLESIALRFHGLTLHLLRGRRLYSSAVFNDVFPEHAPPEIAAVALDGVVLQMKSLAIDRVINFPFPSPPPPDALQVLVCNCQLPNGNISATCLWPRQAEAAPCGSGMLISLVPGDSPWSRSGYGRRRRLLHVWRPWAPLSRVRAR